MAVNQETGSKKTGLTERRIADLRPTPGAQYMVWDPLLKGFGVRVSPGGVKTFTLKYRLASGRVRWKTLGRVGAIPLDKARRFAKDDIGIVARGGDPLEATDAARSAVTVATVATRFLEDYVTPRKKASTRRLYQLAIHNHIVSRLGTRSIGDVDHTDAVKLHDRLRGTPILANRVLAVLSKLLAWSMTNGRYREPGHNPCQGVEKFRERRRKRYLDSAEYARVGKALRALPNSGPRKALELLLLTGARPNEIVTLQWAHVNLSAASLQLPDSKTGEKTIHLSPPAVRLLQRWPRFGESPYVFPGNGHGKRRGAHLHASTLTHVWADLRTTARLDDVRLYDACRHSYASVAVSQHGLTLAQIGAQLGHSQPATTARYAHLHQEVAKQHAATIGDSIAKALSGRAKA